jgi:site-specific DNA-methyltransferase (adenine-specific)
MEPITFEPYTIYRGDCLEILKHFPAECVDLIYIDPPFNSNRNYEIFWGDVGERRAFEDRYGDAVAYIAYMRPRIGELFRVLKPTGSFYYHCDWHASHHIRLMLDETFGANYFRTEIIWKRTYAKGLAFTRMANNHDTIYYYSKGNEVTWNPQYLPLDQQYSEKFYHLVDEETGRRYQLTDITNPNRDRPNLTYEFLGITRVWRWTKERMQKAYEEGRIIQLTPDSVPRYKRYLDETKGKPVDSCWDDIPPLSSQSAERLGYPTQKPLALLRRIINASSNPGDIVLDAFCGCGTTLEACENLNRKWLGIDISPTACRVMGERLTRAGRLELPVTGIKKRGKKYFKFSNLPLSVPQLHALPPFEFENWAVLAVGQFFNMYAQPNRSKVGDLGIDGRLYLPVNIEKHKSKDNEKTPLFENVEGEKYIPIQVKQRDKVGRPDIDKFAHAMERDCRTTGVFVAFGFSREAFSEISRLARADQNPRRIVPLTVERILACDFSAELEVWLKPLD